MRKMHDGTCIWIHADILGCVVYVYFTTEYVHVHMYTLVRQGLTCATTDAFVRVYTFIHKCVHILLLHASLNISITN